MAKNKKDARVSNVNRRYSAKKRPPARAEEKAAAPAERRRSAVPLFEALGVLTTVLGVLAGYVVWFAPGDMSTALTVVKSAIWGVCGILSYVSPVLLLTAGCMLLFMGRGRTGMLRMLGVLVWPVLLAALVHLFSADNILRMSDARTWRAFVAASYDCGATMGAGALGALLGFHTHQLFGTGCGAALLVLVLLLLTLWLMRVSPRAVVESVSKSAADAADNHRLNQEITRRKRAESEERAMRLKVEKEEEERRRREEYEQKLQQEQERSRLAEERLKMLRAREEPQPRPRPASAAAEMKITAECKTASDMKPAETPAREEDPMFRDTRKPLHALGEQTDTKTPLVFNGYDDDPKDSKCETPLDDDPLLARPLRSARVSAVSGSLPETAPVSVVSENAARAPRASVRTQPVQPVSPRPAPKQPAPKQPAPSRPAPAQPAPDAYDGTSDIKLVSRRSAFVTDSLSAFAGETEYVDGMPHERIRSAQQSAEPVTRPAQPAEPVTRPVQPAAEPLPEENVWHLRSRRASEVSAQPQPAQTYAEPQPAQTSAEAPSARPAQASPAYPELPVEPAYRDMPEEPAYTDTPAATAYRDVPAEPAYDPDSEPQEDASDYDLDASELTGEHIYFADDLPAEGEEDDDAQDDEADDTPAPRASSARKVGTYTPSHVSLSNPDQDVTLADGTVIRAPRPAMEKVEEEKPYFFPDMRLLTPAPESGVSRREQRRIDEEKAKRLEETLLSFGIQAHSVGISRGPAITRFELQPAPGVRVNKISNLADDIALNMAATTVRIEAPIPGKQAVGIELPNERREMVTLRDVLDTEEADKAESRLAVPLGRDSAGGLVIADIAKMPHLLIAGATGSGKSVCINTIIMSIIYRATPDEVKMILVDPKVVELSVYNGIPHLLIPVVTDPKKASSALNWAVLEMTERYQKFAKHGVRDIKGYNKTLHEGEKRMPQIVVIIDELADLMMVAPSEVEDSICRLAQLARAAGIHLIIATQRPSVNVITGVIKANIPSRIAFTVSSQVDSRTILDSAGAEKLLGKGDMLYFPQNFNKPQRVQGANVTDEEINAVTEQVKSNTQAVYNQDILDQMEQAAAAADEEKDSGGKADGGKVDPMLMAAVDVAVEMGQLSISMLQRKLHIGYGRAGGIVDELASRGVISEADGSKPRLLLMTREEVKRIYGEE